MPYPSATATSTPRAYENEDRVGAAMARAGVARDEVFLTTKLWLSDLARDPVGPAVDDSLRPLRTDHVDLGSLAFELTDDERRRIDGLERGERLIDPSFAPAWEE
jgi:2,5-diketo-D-gluconate reductase B